MNMLRASMAALTAVVLAGATLDSQQPARTAHRFRRARLRRRCWASGPKVNVRPSPLAVRTTLAADGFRSLTAWLLQRGRVSVRLRTHDGKAINDVGAANLPAPPAGSAGADVSTRLKSEVPLTFADRKVPAGEYSLFIDLNGPTAWTLIVSQWPALQVRS